MIKKLIVISVVSGIIMVFSIGFLFWYTGGTILLKGKMTLFDHVMPDSISLSPKKDRIAFTVFGKKKLGLRSLDIFTIDLNDRSIYQMTNDGMSESPCWLDGTNIVFESRIEGFTNLYVSDYRTKTRTVLRTKKDGVFLFDEKPQVALNGRKVVFERSEVDKKRGIYTIKLYSYSLQEKILTELKDTTIVREFPVNEQRQWIKIHPFLWKVSPSSNEVIILKDTVLFKLNLIDQSKSVLLEGDIADFDYIQSHIVILKRMTANRNVLLVRNLETGREIIIAEGNYGNPKWSQNGKYIAYSDNDRNELWYYDVEKGRNFKVSEGSFLAWLDDETLILQREKIKLFRISKGGLRLQQIFPGSKAKG